MPVSDSEQPPASPDQQNPLSDPGDNAENVQPLAGQIIPHSAGEDIFGVLTGTFVAALGLYILEQAEAVSGGTAGIALLLSFGTPLSLAWLFILVNIPFFALALWRKSVKFTLKTVVSVSIVSGLIAICERYFPIPEMHPVFGVIAGHVLAGVGLLILFRHGSSIGGFNILAIIAQEQFNLRAGYVQMGLDISVILLALTVIAPQNVLLSATGAVIMNLILAFNHRPGRYRA